MGLETTSVVSDQIELGKQYGEATQLAHTLINPPILKHTFMLQLFRDQLSSNCLEEGQMWKLRKGNTSLSLCLSLVRARARTGKELLRVNNNENISRYYLI